jgi:glucokinase
VLRAIGEAGHALGLGMATVLNLLNPELLVVGGGTAGLPGYLDAALSSAERHTLRDTWRACAIRRAREAETVVALGRRAPPVIAE